MRILLYTAFVFLSACGPQTNHEPQKVEYQITITRTAGFLVEIKHDGDPDTSAMVSLDPNAYANYTLLPQDREFQIRYRVTPKSSEPAIADTTIELENGFFQTVGHGFLVCVGQNTGQKKSIKISWKAPVSWRFANSFSADQTEQEFQAECRDLRKALYVGGNRLNIQKTWFGALAIRGFFKELQPRDLEEALERNMRKVLQFWGSDPEPYYFVSVRATNNKQHGGTAQFQSFQLDLSAAQQKNLELDRLITHEFFHDWNGLKINHLPSTDPLSHLDVWWFVEGFTDYYAYLLTKAPDTQQSNNVTLVELKRNYRFNQTYQKIPYVQGRQIARDLDAKIKNHSNQELKHVMHEIIRRSEQDPLFYLTRDNILKVICESNYMPCSEATAILHSYIDLGIPSLLSPPV